MPSHIQRLRAHPAALGVFTTLAALLLRLAFHGVCVLLSGTEGSGFVLFLDLPTVLVLALGSVISPTVTFSIVDSSDTAFHVLGLLVWTVLGSVLGAVLYWAARLRHSTEASLTRPEGRS
jgi:hypothetical protein